MSEPVRVLHVLTILNLGGIENFLMNLYRKIDRTKIQFDFLVHREEEGFFEEEIKSLGGRIFRVQALNPITYNSYLKELNAFFIQHQEYKIVHSHLNVNGAFVLKEARKAAVPIRIAHSHTDKEGGNLKWVKKLIRSQVSKYSSHNFACSIRAGKWLFKEKEFKHVPNVIDIDQFTFSEVKRQQLRAMLGLSEQAIVVGNVARFNFSKNHAFLLQVFKKLTIKNSNYHLLLLGDGTLRSELETTCEKLGIQDKVTMLGAVKNANEYLNVMDLFVFPSLNEGLGIVMVESQANGLPTIITDTLPNEVDQTDLIHRLSLDESTDFWANYIDGLPLNLTNRQQYTAKMKSTEFNIDKTIHWLEDFYVNSIEGL